MVLYHRHRNDNKPRPKAKFTLSIHEDIWYIDNTDDLIELYNTQNFTNKQKNRIKNRIDRELFYAMVCHIIQTIRAKLPENADYNSIKKAASEKIQNYFPGDLRQQNQGIIANNFANCEDLWIDAFDGKKYNHTRDCDYYKFDDW